MIKVLLFYATCQFYEMMIKAGTYHKLTSLDFLSFMELSSLGMLSLRIVNLSRLLDFPTFALTYPKICMFYINLRRYNPVMSL